jgi:type IX secretion system PorP/SprF family membrane protein
MKHTLYIYLFFCWILSLPVISNAQQEAQFTNFMYNKLQLNPAYAGSRGVPTIFGLYRTQWQGINNAPETQLLSFHSPFFSQRVGVGTTIMHRTVGLTDVVQGNVAYSYNLINSRKLGVRFGLQWTGRYQTIKLNKQNLYINDPDDPTLNTGVAQAKLLHNVGAGIYANVKDFYVGVSSPALYRNSVGFVNQTTNYTEQRHFYFMSGAFFPIATKVFLQPAVLLKYTPNAPISTDAHISMVYDSKVTLGTSYRFGTSGTVDSFDFLLHYQLSDLLGIGISYDVNMSALSNYTKGGYEVIMQYDLKRKKKDLSNPRFFF